MSLILATDDLNAGMFVAVFAPRVSKPSHRTVGTDCPGALLLAPIPVPPGIPLRILGVSVPFVACAVIEPGGIEAGPVVIDLRTVTLARIDPAFVDSIAKFEPGALAHDDGGEVEASNNEPQLRKGDSKR